MQKIISIRKLHQPTTIECPKHTNTRTVLIEICPNQKHTNTPKPPNDTPHTTETAFHRRLTRFPTLIWPGLRNRAAHMRKQRTRGIPPMTKSLIPRVIPGICVRGGLRHTNLYKKKNKNGRRKKSVEKSSRPARSPLCDIAAGCCFGATASSLRGQKIRLEEKGLSSRLEVDVNYWKWKNATVFRFRG